MQLAYLAAYCFETQLVTKSSTWQRRRRLKNLFTYSSAAHPEPISSPILLEAATYQPHLFKIKNYHKKMQGLLEAKAAAACFLSPDIPHHGCHSPVTLSSEDMGEIRHNKTDSQCSTFSYLTQIYFFKL